MEIKTIKTLRRILQQLENIRKRTNGQLLYGEEQFGLSYEHVSKIKTRKDDFF